MKLKSLDPKVYEDAANLIERYGLEEYVWGACWAIGSVVHWRHHLGRHHLDYKVAFEKLYKPWHFKLGMTTDGEYWWPRGSEKYNRKRVEALRKMAERVRKGKSAPWWKRLFKCVG